MLRTAMSCRHKENLRCRYDSDMLRIYFRAFSMCTAALRGFFTIRKWAYFFKLWISCFFRVIKTLFLDFLFDSPWNIIISIHLYITFTDARNCSYLKFVQVNQNVFRSFQPQFCH